MGSTGAAGGLKPPDSCSSSISAYRSTSARTSAGRSSTGSGVGEWAGCGMVALNRGMEWGMRWGGKGWRGSRGWLVSLVFLVGGSVGSLEGWDLLSGVGTTGFLMMGFRLKWKMYFKNVKIT